MLATLARTVSTTWCVQHRWRLIEEWVMRPRQQERQRLDTKQPVKSNFGMYRYNEEPFRIRRKDFWPLPLAGKLLGDFIPQLSHECDGLIFQVRVSHTVAWCLLASSVPDRPSLCRERRTSTVWAPATSS